MAVSADAIFRPKLASQCADASRLAALGFDNGDLLEHAEEIRIFSHL
jgi:hypothetical protein